MFELFCVIALLVAMVVATYALFRYEWYDVSKNSLLAVNDELKFASLLSVMLRFWVWDIENFVRKGD